MDNENGKKTNEELLAEVRLLKTIIEKEREVFDSLDKKMEEYKKREVNGDKDEEIRGNKIGGNVERKAVQIVGLFFVGVALVYAGTKKNISCGSGYAKLVDFAWGFNHLGGDIFVCRCYI